VKKNVSWFIDFDNVFVSFYVFAGTGDSQNVTPSDSVIQVRNRFFHKY